jgi:hypothetical protein
VFHIALGDFDEIRDQVIAAFQLNVDLGEGIFEAVAEFDELVIDTSDPEAEDDDEGEESAEDDESDFHGR